MMSMARCCCILLAALLLPVPAAQAGEGGIAVKPDDLRAEPFRDARIVSRLAAGDKVEILKKDGGWLWIKSAKGSGWVRMLSIRRGEARKTTAAAELSGLAGLASGRAGTGRIVAATGIRGLDEEGLKTAKYNEAELKLMESYITSRAEAHKFATRGKLRAHKMDYLPDAGPGETP